VLLTEIFIEDMDGTLRQLGVGDYVVGKHVGRMMGAVGGRLTAFRDGREHGSLAAPVTRNIFHETPPDEAALTFVTGRLERFAEALDGVQMEEILSGRLP
jgi:cytochrome b pre-mRNA-processing protein 3